jgi:hypothetical protein
MALALRGNSPLGNSDEPIGSARVERLDEIRYLAKFVVPTSNQRRA